MAGVRAGGRVTLGVRPENVRLVPACGDGGGVNGGGVPLMVELVEPLGSETLVHGRMADGTALLCKLPGAVEVAERLDVAFDPAALHLFDAVSGVRIEA